VWRREETGDGVGNRTGRIGEENKGERQGKTVREEGEGRIVLHSFFANSTV